MRGHDFRRRQEVGPAERRRGKALGAKRGQVEWEGLVIIEGRDRQRSLGLIIRYFGNRGRPREVP